MSDPRQPPMWLLAIGGLVAGTVLGLALAAGWATLRSGSTTDVTLAPLEPGPPPDHVDNARSFIAAWQRFRTGTFVVELEVRRELADGRSITFDRVVVQEPPRRVVRQSGSVSALLNEETLTCDTVAEELICTSGGQHRYERAVEEELAAWATAFAGDDPVYVVERPDEHCYDLRLAKALAAAPYGDQSRICFDEATGALVARQVVRATATDTEQMTGLRPVVTEADFAEVLR